MSRPMTPFVRLYRVGLWLLPARFRSDFGSSLIDTVDRRVEEAARTRGLGGAARATAWEMVDLLRTVGREWKLELRSHFDEGAGTRNDGRRDWMGTLLQDTRYAVRGLLRQPWFSIVAILTLALGIGANTAVFTVVDAALFRPPPFEGGERFAVLWERSNAPDGSLRQWVSYPDYQDLTGEQRSFDVLAAYRSPRAILSGGGDPTSVPALRITASVFELVGSEMALGRPFTAAEDAVDRDRVVVISHGLWARRFGQAPDVLGRTVPIDGAPHTIVGVLPEGLAFPSAADVWLPAAPDVASDSRGMHRLVVVGRLREGVTAEAASADVATIMARLEREYPDSNKDQGAWVEPFTEANVGSARTTLLLFLGAVALVLFIVCANVANLLLARTTGRAQEVAVRTAIGAARSRVVRLLLTESAILATAGGVLGAFFGWATVATLVALAPPGALPIATDLGLDARVLGVMGLVTLSTVVLFGVVPALKGARCDVAGRLREGGRLRGADGSGRLRRGLVVFETALAVVLAVTAGLLTRSFIGVQSVDPGFDPVDLWEVPISLPFSEYTSERWPEVAQFFGEISRRTAELPGVEAAASTYASPLDAGWSSGFWFEGRPAPASTNDWPSARYRPVTPGYFATVGIPLVRGREFTTRDDANAPAVVVINESLAREHFPGEDPIGKRIVKSTWWEGTPEGPWEIVGVATDVRFLGRDRASQPALYFPHAQRPMTDMTLMFRTERDVADVLPAIREAVWSLDPDIPVENVRGAGAGLEAASAGRRFTMLLMTAFGGGALLLAAVGLFGVLSYWVNQRTHEIGVRVSLGARPGDVRGLVVGQGVRLTAVGAGIGLLSGVAVSRATGALLFGVRPADPITFVAVGSLVFAIALLASYLPALRATRVDPVRALQSG